MRKNTGDVNVLVSKSDMFRMMTRLAIHEAEVFVTTDGKETVSISLQSHVLGESAVIRRGVHVQQALQAAALASQAPLQIQQASALVLESEQEDKQASEEDLQQRQQELLQGQMKLQRDLLALEKAKLVFEKEKQGNYRCESEAPTSFIFRKDSDQCPTCKAIKCDRCPFIHVAGRCHATGKTCNFCGQTNHYQSKCPEKREIEIRQNNKFTKN